MITGASGNVGTGLLRRLAPAYEVVGLVRRLPPAMPPYDSARWESLDIARPDALARLRALLEGADCFVHLAWPLQPMRARGYLRGAGPRAMARVIRAALEARVPRVIHVSSVAAYQRRTREVRVGEDWPLGGIPSSAYSTDKARGERILAQLVDGTGAQDRVAVVRPCLVAQRDAAGAMLRCALPPVVPNAALRHPRLIPTDPDFGIQLVHADDVADAIARIIDRGASGAFNLAAEPVLRAGDIVEVLQARSLPLSSEHSRRLVALAWKARLHPLDPGWVDMALQVPWMDTEKARRVLGWTPRRDAREVLGELVDAMGDGAGTASPALRRRQLLEEVGHTLRHGPTSRRERT